MGKKLEEQAKQPPLIRIIGFFIEGKDNEKEHARPTIEKPRETPQSGTNTEDDVALFPFRNVQKFEELDPDFEEPEDTPIIPDSTRQSSFNTGLRPPAPSDCQVEDPLEEQRKQRREKLKRERQALEKERLEKERKQQERAEKEREERERLKREKERQEKEGMDKIRNNNNVNNPTPNSPQKKITFTLSDFIQEKKLGTGSFGDVKLVKHEKTKIQYALKIIDKKLLERRNQVKTVIREKEILSRLNHPNIVRLVGTFLDPSKVYFLLEYCPNGDLFHCLKKTGPLKEDVACFCAAELVCGLEYMHNQGIMHRDIKPENVLLGPKMHLKLNDFGTAREFADESSTNNIVESTFTGTAEYMSPELLNSKPAGKSADLWALGCVIYQMLVGRPPFRGSTNFITFQKVENREFSFPPEIEISHNSKDIINKLLDPVPDSRLGNQNYSDLTSHPFFDSLIEKWPKLPNMEPPLNSVFETLKEKD